MAHSDWHFARLSPSELDQILRFDPEVSPNDDPAVKLTEFSRHISSVQSTISDALETW